MTTDSILKFVSSNGIAVFIVLLMSFIGYRFADAYFENWKLNLTRELLPSSISAKGTVILQDSFSYDTIKIDLFIIEHPLRVE